MIKAMIFGLLTILALFSGCAATMSSSPASQLPPSMKGYELYSWNTVDGWHFTLITGTNRNKTADEITSPGETVSPDGWVKIHVLGAESIVNVLGRLPRGEEVFWLKLPEGAQVNEALPQDIVELIKSGATAAGVKLTSFQQAG